MALVAKMVASEVIDSGGMVNTPCAPDDPGARPVEEVYANWTYGVPRWFRDAGVTHVRGRAGKVSQRFKMMVVSASGDPDDPNRDFAEASPSGELTMTLNNPAGFGYVEAGEDYVITISKARKGQHPWEAEH